MESIGSIFSKLFWAQTDPSESIFSGTQIISFCALFRDLGSYFVLKKVSNSATRTNESLLCMLAAKKEAEVLFSIKPKFLLQTGGE